MRMMPMPRVDEFKAQISDTRKELKSDSVEKTTFKSEYDKKVDSNETAGSKEIVDKTTTVENKTEKVVDSENKEKTPEKNDENKQVKSVENKDSKVLENVNKNSSKEVNITESFIDKLKSVEVKDKDSKKNIKNIKNIDKKTDKDKNVKNGDKDSLNQSIVAGQLLQTPVTNENKIETKKDKDSSEDNIINISDITDTKKNSGVEQKASLNIINNNVTQKSSKVESKKEKSEKSESKIKVNDLRSENKNMTAVSEKVVKASNSVPVQPVELESADGELSEAGIDKTIILGTTEVTAEGDGGKSQAPVMKEAASLLKQQLKDFGNNEIVKQSRFILKDNNVGEIKLILKPESLGQVKINLNLNENSLVGQIVVENNSVKEVFQENLNQLSKSLVDQGYDSAKLDISLNDKEGSEQQGNKKQNRQYFSDRLKRIDESGQVVRYGAPSAGINLTA